MSTRLARLRGVTGDNSGTMAPVLLYKRFGAVFFAHFFQRLGDEGQALSATRAALAEVLSRTDASEAAARAYLASLSPG